jgi:hypothetical protein
MKYDSKQESGLMRELWDLDIADYPERFVRVAMPWKKPNTPLAEFDGPDVWQDETLTLVGEYVRENKKRVAAGKPSVMFRDAVGSGRGIGKSAELGMISHWYLSTRIGGTGIVSANGEPQLRSVTFPEIKKWFAMSVNSHWFDDTSMSIFPQKWFADALTKQLSLDCSYYYLQAKLWTEENPDAYAGPHSQVGMLLLFDEASGIPSPIWNTAEGFFSDKNNPCRVWLARSNPRRNIGGFADCFTKRDLEGDLYWKTRHINSLDVNITDKEHLRQVIEKNRNNPDVARVEVYGQFPETGDRQLISAELVKEAQNRETFNDPGSPLIMGVDVARGGSDATVCRFRKGRDARSIPSERWRKATLTDTAKRVAALIDLHKPDAVCIDQGMGSGVIDILKSLKYRGIHEVAFGGSSSKHELLNKRTELFYLARDFLGSGCVDGSADLMEELITPEYYFVGDKINIMSNDDIKSIIGRSSDEAAAFLLTFAASPARKDAMFHRKPVVAQDVGSSIFNY